MIDAYGEKTNWEMKSIGNTLVRRVSDLVNNRMEAEKTSPGSTMQDVCYVAHKSFRDQSLIYCTCKNSSVSNEQILLFASEYKYDKIYDQKDDHKIRSIEELEEFLAFIPSGYIEELYDMAKSSIANLKNETKERISGYRELGNVSLAKYIKELKTAKGALIRINELDTFLDDMKNISISFRGKQQLIAKSLEEEIELL